MGVLVYVIHVFRMSVFFLIAGLLSRALFHRLGPRGFWRNRARRIALPLVLGWIVCFALLGAVVLWGLARAHGGTLPPIPEETLDAGLNFLHLWFLYILLWLYAMAWGVHAVMCALDRRGRVMQALDRLLRALLASPLRSLALALPIAAALGLQPLWDWRGGVPTPGLHLAAAAGAAVRVRLRVRHRLDDRPPACAAGQRRARLGHARRDRCGCSLSCAWARRQRLRPARRTRAAVALALCARLCAGPDRLHAGFDRRRLAVSERAVAPVALRRRRVVLDVHRAPAAGDGVADRVDGPRRTRGGSSSRRWCSPAARCCCGATGFGCGPPGSVRCSTDRGAEPQRPTGCDKVAQCGPPAYQLAAALSTNTMRRPGKLRSKIWRTFCCVASGVPWAA